MTRLRRIVLTVLVGVVVALPTAGPAFAHIDNTGDGYEDVAYRWEWKAKFRVP